MTFDVTFNQREIRLTLSERLELPEGHRWPAGLPDALYDDDLRLEEIQALVRRFLAECAAGDRGAQAEACPSPGSPPCR